MKKTERRCRVLLADDERGYRRDVARELRSDGFDVLETINPEQAMEALDKQDFDIVILDLVMPGYDVDGGHRVLKYIDGWNKEKARPRVFILSAFGYNGPADRALQEFGHLVKRPVLLKTPEPGDIVKTIRESLNNGQGRKKRGGGGN